MAGASSGGGAEFPCGAPSSESSDCPHGSVDRRAVPPACAGCRVSSVAASTRAATCTQSVPTAQLQYPRRNRSGNPLEARNEADTVLISPPPSLTVPVSSCCEASQAICTIAPRLTGGGAAGQATGPPHPF